MIPFSNLLKSAIPFVWTGLLLGISFLETPLKFQAPGISLTLGLGIGQLVFTALNQVEWVLGSLLVMSYWLDRRDVDRRHVWLIVGLVATLLLQSGWLLPVLNQRVALYQRGVIPGPSPVHFYYIGGELLKIGCLLSLGWLSLRNHQIASNHA